MANKHSWFLTINNPTEADLELCRAATRSSSITNRQIHEFDGTYVNTMPPTKLPSSNHDMPIKGLAFFGFAQETGKHGTPHIHCVVVFKQTKSFQTLKKLFPRANIQPVRGTFKECINYTRKDGRFYSISFVPTDRNIQYVENDNKLAKLSLEGDVSLTRLENRITNLEDKLDRLISLISQKKILNTLRPDENVL